MVAPCREANLDEFTAFVGRSLPATTRFRRGPLANGSAGGTVGAVVTNRNGCATPGGPAAYTTLAVPYPGSQRGYRVNPYRFLHPGGL